MGSKWFGITQDKVTESVPAMEVTMAELLVFGLLSSTAEVSGMPNYQVPVKGLYCTHLLN
jgi:hypothetical protein